MFYRIIKAPPGYALEQQYLVGAYETLEYDSFRFNMTKDDGTKFAPNLDEAYRMIPTSAKRLPFDPEFQFLELWEG
jgi:hypothetical protein